MSSVGALGAHKEDNCSRKQDNWQDLRMQLSAPVASVKYRCTGPL